MSNFEKDLKDLREAVCIKKAAKYNLKECLEDLKKEQLKAYVKNYDIVGTSKFKKEELIDAISESVSAGTVVKSFLEDIKPNELTLINKALESEYVDINDVDANYYVRLFLLAIAFPYSDGEEYKLVMPSEVKELFKSMDTKSFGAQKSDKKIGRNEPCPCGSGKKYKKCCMK